MGCGMWQGTGLELMVGRLRLQIVGILGAKDLRLGIVPQAGLCPLCGAAAAMHWSQPAVGLAVWVPRRLQGLRVVRRELEACEGLHWQPAASMDHASCCWALLPVLECHLSLLTRAGNTRFRLSSRAFHMLLLRPPAQPSI